MTRKASVLASGWLRHTGVQFGLAAALAIAVGISPIAAQQKDGKQAPAAKKAEPAKGKDAQPAQQQSAWVKLCEKAPMLSKDKDGKDVKEEKNVCLTHHERLDGNTGMVLVSAAIRQIEGADKNHLMVMVPLGMAVHPGLRASIYTKEMWELAQKNQKVDDSKLDPIKLSYALCHPAGCTAEVEAGNDVVAKMKTGGGLMIMAINAQGQVIAFPVPLTGFAEAFDGKPVDNQKYSEARKTLMAQIAQRQQQMMEEYRKQQATGSAGGQQAPTAAAKGAPPAAEKKK
jgi:invasion protein IalB